MAKTNWKSRALAAEALYEDLRKKHDDRRQRITIFHDTPAGVTKTENEYEVYDHLLIEVVADVDGLKVNLTTTLSHIPDGVLSDG